MSNMHVYLMFKTARLNKLADYFNTLEHLQRKAISLFQKNFHHDYYN